MSGVDFRARQRARRLLTCVHFNGTDSKRCREGLCYKDFGPAFNDLPCVWGSGDNPQAGPDKCEKRRYPTEAELDAEDKKNAESLARWVNQINQGVCPHCKKSCEPKKQIGRCVYGACGCRLYQGRI